MFDSYDSPRQKPLNSKFQLVWICLPKMPKDLLFFIFIDWYFIDIIFSYFLQKIFPTNRSLLDLICVHYAVSDELSKSLKDLLFLISLHGNINIMRIEFRTLL